MKKIFIAAVSFDALGLNVVDANTAIDMKTQISATAEDPFKTTKADQRPQAGKDAVR